MNTPLPGTLCLFMSGVRAVQFYSHLPGASLDFTPKALFFSFPFGRQCLKLRLACAQLSSLLFLISNVPSISHTRLLLWYDNAAVRPSAILIDVKIREKPCPSNSNHAWLEDSLAVPHEFLSFESSAESLRVPEEHYLQELK